MEVSEKLLVPPTLKAFEHSKAHDNEGFITKNRDYIVGYSFALLSFIIPISLLLVRYLVPSTAIRIVNEPLHAAIEMMAALLALGLGALLYFLQSQLSWSDTFFWISCSLLSNGTVTALHAAFPGSVNTMTVMEAAYTFNGALLAVLVCLPKFMQPDIILRKWILIFTFIISIAEGLLILLSQDSLPAFVTPNGAFTNIKTEVGILSFAMYLLATLKCGLRFFHSRQISDLFLTDYLALLGFSSVIPAYFFFIWGPVWWGWHILQIVAMMGILLIFVELAVRFQSELSERENRYRNVCIKLHSVNESMKHFTSFASHDLKEPLRTIKFCLGHLEKLYGELKPHEKKFLEFAVDGADRMQDLIEGFLHYAKIDSPDIELEQVNLNHVLEEVRKNISFKLSETECKVISETLPQVYGHRSQLIDLFQNLIVNAIRFKHPDRQPVIQISAKKTEGYEVISIKDNGIGIEERQFSKIFELLIKLHGHEVSGTGLGLAICKKIMERHSGKIQVASMFGQWTEFTLFFPERTSSHSNSTRIGD